jgi:hypothetical protein
VAKGTVREDWDGDFTLDGEFRFVSVDKTIRPGVQNPIGRNIWDAYGGESVFRAQYESVLATGRPAKFRAYHGGLVVETLAEMEGRYLRIRYRVIATVDVSSLDRLLETMEGVTRALEAPYGTPTEDPKRSGRRSSAPLRVVEGS